MKSLFKSILEPILLGMVCTGQPRRSYKPTEVRSSCVILIPESCNTKFSPRCLPAQLQRKAGHRWARTHPTKPEQRAKLYKARQLWVQSQETNVKPTGLLTPRYVQRDELTTQRALRFLRKYPKRFKLFFSQIRFQPKHPTARVWHKELPTKAPE